MVPLLILATYVMSNFAKKIQINKFLTVIGQNFVKTQLCEDPNGHELQLEEAKRLLHVDLVKTTARKKNLSSNS